MLRVSGLKLSIEDDSAKLTSMLLKKLGINQKDLMDYKIFRKSVDARQRDSMIFFNYTVDAALKNEEAVLKRLYGKGVAVAPDMEYVYVRFGLEKLKSRPVILGSGPAGLFAGIILSDMGYRPLLLERGADVDTRARAVRQFMNKGELDTECNIQFGEGGAGTFSDGKLTTLIRDTRCRKVLEEMVLAGAPAEILYLNKPHVGTDNLRIVVKNLREKIVRCGGEIRFNSKVTDIDVVLNRIAGIVVNYNEKIPADVLLIAPGHSARDTFEMLHKRNVLMSPKPFSIGVRIEHRQELIDRAQYKRFAGHEKLGPADYKLAYHASNGRSAYTFCMCPGGEVVPATSEEGCVVTNGMSLYARSALNANSALLVGVGPGDFGSSHPLAGVEFQRRWERLAFALGGGNYNAPAQLVGDYLAGRASTGFRDVTPSYRKAVRPANLEDCLPPYVLETIKEALPELDKKLRGFAAPDAVMTGVETRSSSPVRIFRSENFEAGIGGLYPAGEGAGYAGGIISSAVDGIKAAEAIASKYCPLG